MKMAHAIIQASIAVLCASAAAIAAPGGYLGVYLTDEEESTAGAIVEDVAPDSPAARVGLRRGDRVVACDGEPTPNGSVFIARLVASEPGTVLELDVERDGWRRTIPVELGGRRDEQREPKEEEPQHYEGGFLGVFLRQDGAGAVVERVIEGSPAAVAGLRPGDVVLAVGDVAVTEPRSLIAVIAAHRPGATLTLRVRRGEQELRLDATLGRRPALVEPPAAAQPAQPAPPPDPEERKPPYLGLALVDAGGAGPLKVDDVQAGSPAERFGIRPGDVICAIDGTEVKTIDEFAHSLGSRHAGETVALKIEREGWRSELRVTLGARPE